MGAGPCRKSLPNDFIFWVKVESQGGVRGLYLPRDSDIFRNCSMIVSSIKNPLGVAGMKVR